MNFCIMTWVEEATATGAAGMVVDQSPQEEAPMNIDSSSAGGGDERHSNSNSSEDGGSGSEGGAEESSSSSSVPVVMATRRSSSVIQKKQEEQVEEDSDINHGVSASNAKKMSSSDQQNSSPLSASVTVKPGAVIKSSYKDYSHEFPTEKQLYLQQPGVATAWEGELVAAWEQELFTTTTNRGTAACLFPLKLHEMLSDHAEQLEKNIVVWQPHGRSFKIHNQEQFVETILPKYFSSSATTSEAWFLEQLRDYGFHLLVGPGPDQGSYYHEKFLRGMKFLCPQIVPQSATAAGNGEDDDVKTVVNPDDSEPVLKRYPICPPIPLQRMFREKGIAVSDFSNSFVTTRLRQASAIMAAAAASQSDKLRSTLTPLDESSLKLLLNNGVGGGQACFPLKLHRVLQHLAENGHDDIMSWLPNGRAFVIRDLDRFVTELMPVYFHRMSKFNSFTRQIHMYHFKQVQGGPDKFAYRHDYFLRDEPDLCLQIQRTRKVRDAVVTPSEASDDTKPPPTTLALPQEHDDSSCPSMAVVTPTKADTTTAAVDLIALECMMREQGQGCAVYTSKPAASSKRSRKASTPTKKKQKTKPKTTTPMPSPTSIAESVNHVMMPMMPWSPTHTPESLDSILSTSPKTAKYSWPLRLQRLLDKHEAEGDDQIISWLPHGHSFAVHDPVKFLAEIMPVYFRHSTKFNSFTRQLYEYSFRRYSSGKYKSVFYHPHFLRGQPHEALKISRIRRYKDGKSLVPEIPTVDPALFDQLALPRIAAGATIDVPADPLADAKRKATTTSSSLTASSSSIDGPTLDDFAIFDEDELELGLWREALDQYADV